SATRKEGRVLVLAPTRKDGELTASMLSDVGVECELCGDIRELCQTLESDGAGALLVAEEALAGESVDVLIETLALQPAWSDVPVLLLTHPGADSPTVMSAMDRFPNVT